MGTDDGSRPRYIRLCDFSSAANSWAPAARYRVWLPKALDPILSPAP